MSAPIDTPSLTLALIGNPNTGKSTLFSGLVDVRQQVGNYPGVTVEKKSGWMQFAGRRFELVDLPGLYSLAPRSRDEMVAVDLLIDRRPDEPRIDAVLCILDAANLERNLYLLSQVLELELPTVVVVNMLDVAEQRGIRVDLNLLERRLGAPVAAIQANRRIGLARVKELLTGVEARREGRGTCDKFSPGGCPAINSCLVFSTALTPCPSPRLTLRVGARRGELVFDQPSNRQNEETSNQPIDSLPPASAPNFPKRLKTKSRRLPRS